jgi:hypothetical protein
LTTKSIKDFTNTTLSMEVEYNNSVQATNYLQKHDKSINYEELITKQPNEIIYILVQKINSQQQEISGLWNKLRKNKKRQ